jgi:hypothetical protein
MIVPIWRRKKEEVEEGDVGEGGVGGGSGKGERWDRDYDVAGKLVVGVI